MKNHIVRYLLLCLSFAFTGVLTNAQNDTLSAAAGDRYVISAKAGGVNFVEGTVTVARKNGRGGLLLKGDTLEIGDRVSTGADGKAEILLNPGSYLRLGGNSAFEFKTTSLDDLQVKVDSGSAILEVFAAEQFKVGVTTPSTEFVVVQTGVYRVDILNQREARLEVWKGSARASGEEVKSGRLASVTASGDVSVVKFDRDDQDGLDVWSKARSKELAKHLARLKQRDVRTALMRSFLGNGWNMYNSFGLWVYNPYYGGHCFLPFGHGWHSPYGHGYPHSIYWYKMPRVIYSPPNPNTPPPTSGGNSQTGVKASTSPGELPIPAFVVMQQAMGNGIRGTDRGNNSSYDSGSSSSPSYSPSYSPPSSSSSSPSSSSSTGAKSDPTGTKP